MQRGDNRQWPRCDHTQDEESRVSLRSELNGSKAKCYERICIQPVEAFAWQLSMQLRKHPIMAFWGYSRWPPIWIEYQGTNESTLVGEIGVLRRALSHPCNPRQIFLTIGHEGAEYIGCLLMEYEFLGVYMARLLNDCIGMTIESIGSLEVPLTFETKKAQTARAKLWH